MKDEEPWPMGLAGFFNPPSAKVPGVVIMNAPEVIAGWVEAWTRALPPPPPWPEHLVPPVRVRPVLPPPPAPRQPPPPRPVRRLPK